MIRRLLFLLACSVLLTAGSAQAGSATDGLHFLAQIENATSAADLSAEQALLYKFHYIFAQDKLPAAYRPSTFSPLKCGTDMIREFEVTRDQLSAATVATIEAYLDPNKGGDVARATYISPSEHFQLTYSTTGANAVSAVDVNPANGVPDYVERCASYMDMSWETECDVWGFTEPPVSTYYDVRFENMGSYGYTTVTGTYSTRITLHNSFIGFPPNDDPEGDQLGAAKVTCAHEFKHASQRAGSRWTEGGWVELDATWAEELVYDIVNDYYNYIIFNQFNPIRRPDVPLDAGGTGSYEDCVWQIFMSEEWGPEIIWELWEWRKTHTSQSMMQSYFSIFYNMGETPMDAWGLFSAWNYATATRGTADFGYDEAGEYPLAALAGTAWGYPYSVSGDVDHLAANLIRCTNVPQEPGTFRIEFDCATNVFVRLNAFVKTRDLEGQVVPIPLDSNNDADFTLPIPLDEIESVGIAIGNVSQGDNNLAWSITVSTGPPPTDPEITLSADDVFRTLDPNQTATEYLDITNSGSAGSVMNYTVTVEPEAPLLDVPWLVVTPDAGSLAQGETEQLALDFDTTGMMSGIYEAFVVITHNAPGSPSVVPVTLTVTDILAVSEAPDVFALQGNYPNPFNPVTMISFKVDREALVSVDILDLQGRRIRVLLQDRLPVGSHEIRWDGRDDSGRTVAAGTYLARLQSDGRNATVKMVLAK